MWSINIGDFNLTPKVETKSNLSDDYIKCKECRNLNKKIKKNEPFYKEYYNIKYENEDILKVYKTNTSSNTLIMRELINEMNKLLEKYDMKKGDNEIEFNIKKKYCFWNSTENNKIIVNRNYIDNMKNK